MPKPPPTAASERPARGRSRPPAFAARLRAIDDCAWAGQHAQAVALADAALASSPGAAQQLALRDRRADSLVALGELERALADAQQMLALATQARRPALQAQALSRLAAVQMRQGRLADAAASAAQALGAARRCGRPALQALALLRLSEAGFRRFDNAAALRHAQEAARLFAALPDPVWQGRALWAQAYAHDQLGQTRARERCAVAALKLARDTGDQQGIGAAANLLYREHADMALRLRGLKEAIAAFVAAGQPERAGAALGNLAMAYGSIGLYARARNPGGHLASTESINALRQQSGYFPCVLSVIDSEMGHREQARLHADEAAAAAAQVDDPWLAIIVQLVLGRAARLHEEWPAARRHFDDAVARADAKGDTTLRVVTRTELGRLLLQTGEAAAALAVTRQAVEQLHARGDGGMGSMFTPAAAWWWHARALQDCGQAAPARRALATAYHVMLDGVASLSDAGLRRSWFNKVAAHRALILAWVAQGRQRRLPPARYLAHLDAPTQLREPFERLVDTGVRMNQLHHAVELHDFLVEEAAELSGAERVLLVLADADDPGALTIAGAALPLGEAPQPLLQAVTPWLAEAQHTRLARLRHGPEGAMPLDQRSCVVAPLIAQRRLLGYLYADIEGVFGRFADSDRDLLALLATQAAVALANLRASEGLEAKVAERTALLEQRAGELAVINTIQQGVAQSLDFGAIVELVGDKLREVFHSGSIHISWVDEASGEVRTPYACEQGRRVQVGVVRPNRAGPMWTTLAAGGAVVANDAQQMQAFGLKPVPGTTPSTATAIVPVCGGGRLCGAISVQHHDGRGRFAEAEVRLLGTVATSMGTALENVRLFSQTKAALERQTATAEVLQVLSGSVAETAPVFDKILEGCARLFDSAEQGIVLVGAGGHMELAAHRGPALPKLQQVFAARLPASDFEPIILRGKPIHIVDIYAPGVPPMLRDIAEQLQSGAYSQLIVPMAWEGRAIGLISVIRHPPEGFSATEIAQLQTFADQAVIALQNARLFNDTKEALEQQTATAEVLKVISSSPTDVQPVFDTIAERARHLCDAVLGWVFTYDGEWIDIGSISAADAEARELLRSSFPMRADGRTVVARAVRDHALVNEPDVLADPGYALRDVAQRVRYRSALAVPMQHDGRIIGVVTVARAEVGRFPDKQVKLLQTFADQAVIAIENVRLFNETKEALERQTASAGILRVLSASPSAVKPVFDAITASAWRLLGSAYAVVLMRAGDGLKLVSLHREGRAVDVAPDTPLLPLDPEHNFPARVLLSDQALHLPDWSKLELPPHQREIQADLKIGSSLTLPLRRDGECIGVLGVGRTQAQAFAPREIALLESFADQAVIAIGNVRLFNETREALQRQTASHHILKVMAASPGDVQPVFDAIVADAQRLTGATTSHANRVDGEWLQLAAFSASDEAGAAAMLRMYPLRIADYAVAPALRAGQPVLVADAESDARVSEAIRSAMRARGVRSTSVVPMMRGGEWLGNIVVNRAEPGLLDERRLELLRGFADQAVIALENARLFNETKEALDQQRASAEVLTAISNSIADTQPVFDVILQSCQRLFASETVGMTMVRADGLLDFGAYVGPGEAELRKMWPRPLNRDTATGRAILDQRLTAYEDVDDGAMPPASITGARAMGLRSMAFAPMVYGGHGIGSLWIGRKAISRFPPKELALLQTFADQAVIAIQNARLFNETREALERQTATADILKVIAGSPSDVQPVFDAIAERARALCGAQVGATTRFDGEWLHLVGVQGGSAEGQVAMRAAFPMKPGRGSINARTIQAKAPVQVADVDLDPEYQVTAAAHQLGFRAGLGVSMLFEGEVIGAIFVGRAEPGVFPDKLVALLQTFADQAVIAIQNTRLFNETKEALDQQQAAAAVLGVIGRSVADALPVFEVIRDRLERLLPGAQLAIASAGDDGLLHWRAGSGTTVEAMRGIFPRPVPGPGLLTGSASYWPDLLHGEGVPEGLRAAVRDLGGNASMLSAAMVSQGQVLGTIAAVHLDLKPFSANDARIVKTFADQAAIAIRNAQLFNETQQSLERQTATAEVLQVISASPTDVQPVFDAIAERAKTLCDGLISGVSRFDGELVHLVAYHGVSPEVEAKVRALFPMKPSRESITARAVLAGAPVQIEDMQADADYAPALRQAAAEVGSHSTVAVPMFKDGRAIGAISVGRAQPGAFPERQVQLLQTFADQAVIAIENVRLFRETQDALQQQKASADVLAVISSSVADTQPVFDKILQSCKHLFGSDETAVLLVDEADQVTLGAYVGAQRDAVAATFPAPLAKSPAGEAIRTRQVAHYPDARHDPRLTRAVRRVAAAGGYQAMAYAPMLWNARGIGAIGVSRLRGGFAEKELALLQTFADQAVIAIQNTRLFNDTKEALEQQTATAEVLQVIGSSVADTAPVFDRILHSCQHLFATGQIGIFLRGDDDQVHATAWRGDVVEAIARTFPRPAEQTITGQVMRERRVIAVADAAAMADAPPSVRAMLDTSGNFSAVWAPMVWEGRGVGALCVFRQPPRPFTDKELALLQTFADQAVIAIQNTRLFRETQQALEQQTASAEVLRVISSSMADASPVFEAVAEACQRLFDGEFVGINLIDEHGGLYLAASRYPVERDIDRDAVLRHFAEAPMRTEGTRLKLRGEVVDFPDIEQPGVPDEVAVACRISGTRSVTYAPMVSAGKGIGAIWVGRAVTGTMDEQNRTLFKAFADQAVIAIQNARLFKETQEARAARRSGERGEEFVPGDDEPRDPHADERRHRHERAAARHAAGARAARLRRDHPRLGRRAADDHQRHPRLLEDRGRPHGGRASALRPARLCRVGARPGRSACGREAPGPRLRLRRRSAARRGR